MPALNFKEQFAPKILEGSKRQTIRATRKHPIKVGDRLYLYIGMRTKVCTKIAEAICIEHHLFTFSWWSTLKVLIVTIEDYALPVEMIEELAIADGFDDVTSFINFFIESPKSELYSDGLIYFSGQLIKWGELCRH